MPPGEARDHVAATLVELRPDWDALPPGRRDTEVWEAVCLRAGIAVLTDEVPRMVDRHGDPLEDPAPWLARAEQARATRRRRRAVIVGAVVAGLVAAVAALSLLTARPEQPPVREERNRLPVPWHDGAELHLADVVVALPDVEAFRADGDGVLVRTGDGDVLRVGPDGAVETGEQFVDVPDPGRPDALPSAIEVRDTVVGPGGVVVVSARLGAGSRDADDYRRLSGTGQDVVYVCSGACRLLDLGASVRLR